MKEAKAGSEFLPESLSVSMILDEFIKNRNGVLEWLLQPGQPSVVYYSLTRLLKKKEQDSQVRQAREDIMLRGLVPAILSQQNADGSWAVPLRFYHQKFTGAVWQLMILAEHFANPEDERVRKTCNFILENSQEQERFGFAYNKSGNSQGGRPSEVIPCLTGNMVWSLSRLGMLEDEGVQKGIDWICRYQRADDGAADFPADWPYKRFEMCYGKPSCHMGVVKSLKALAEIPPDKRNAQVQDKIKTLAEFLLIHHLFKKSHDLEKVSKPGWLKPGFPLMYQTDILEILEILVSLGYRDPRMQAALAILEKKQGPEGRWKLENSFNGKMLVNSEKKGAWSRWITAKALYVLTRNGNPLPNF